MSLAISSFMRKALVADALVSGAAALLMMAGSGLLGPFLGLPVALLFWSGLALVPFVALLVAVARRARAPRVLVLDIVLVNALWAAASFAILLTGLVTPNLLGTAFVSAQALAVALFALLQAAGLRGAMPAAA